MGSNTQRFRQSMGMQSMGMQGMGNIPNINQVNHNVNQTQQNNQRPINQRQSNSATNINQQRQSINNHTTNTYQNNQRQINQRQSMPTNNIRNQFKIDLIKDIMQAITIVLNATAGIVTTIASVGDKFGIDISPYRRYLIAVWIAACIVTLIYKALQSYLNKLET